MSSTSRFPSVGKCRWLPQATDEILKMLMFLGFKLSTKGVCSLNVQWAESLQCAEKSVGEVCQCGSSVFLGKYEEAAAHINSPFAAELCSAGAARNTFCIFHCLLLFGCTSATKVTHIFAEKTEGGQRAARFMHRFPFPSSPVQDSLNRFFVNRAPGNGESASGAACSARLCPFCSSALFHSPCSSWWMTCPPTQPLSLEASSPQCREKRDCLLSAAPFAPHIPVSCLWGNTSGILALPKCRSFSGSRPRSSVADRRVLLNLAAFESDSPLLVS